MCAFEEAGYFAEWSGMHYKMIDPHLMTKDQFVKTVARIIRSQDPPLEADVIAGMDRVAWELASRASLFGHFRC